MKKKGFLNENHPERREDEIYLCNTSEEEFRFIGWQTKRLGNQAYTIEGHRINPISKLYPVFVTPIAIPLGSCHRKYEVKDK